MFRPTTLVRVTAFAIAAVYTLLIFLSGLALPDWVKSIVALFPTAAVLALILWDLFLWRLPFVQKFTRRPDLRGLWTVELIPTKDSVIPEGGDRGPIPAFMEIRQTFWSLHARLYSAQSASTSSAASWLPTFETDVDSLTYVYANVPRMSESHRSMRSTGSCTLEPTVLKPTEMLGTYFTDRFTKGDMKCNFVDRSKGHAFFEAATKHAAAASDPGE